MLSGGKAGQHAIQGIGAGFVPPVFDRDAIDDVLCCTDNDAFDTARRLAREEGISGGISAGAAVWGALRVAQELSPEQRVVTVIPDSWDRYISIEFPDQSLGALDFII